MNLLHNLHRVSQTADDLYAKRAPADITLRQAVVLQCLKANPNVSQTFLVEQTGIDRATLASMVDRLIGKGWTVRHRTKEDARRYAVKLTVQGDKMLSQAQAAAEEAEKALLVAIPSVRHLMNGK